MLDFTLLNWWNEPIARNWFYRFMRHNNILPSRPVYLASVFGSRANLDRIPADAHLIFFSGENISSSRYSEYLDYCLHHPRLSLSLGFPQIESPNYLRFPLWLTYVFDPRVDFSRIERCINRLMYPLSVPSFVPRFRFASMVSSHDPTGVRRDICASLADIRRVACGGALNRNSYSLKLLFMDRKIDYLRSFFFNICPENSDTDAYVTEKIFQSIQAGCIPIYHGSVNNPEPGILNHKAIFFWKSNSSNYDLIGEIAEVFHDKRLLREKLQMPRLRQGASSVIKKIFSDLYRHLKSLE